MSNGHDEVARQMIHQHMSEYGRHVKRMEGMFSETGASIRRLHERWDHLLWSVAAGVIMLLIGLVGYIWSVQV